MKKTIKKVAVLLSVVTCAFAAMTGCKNNETKTGVGATTTRPMTDAEAIEKQVNNYLYSVVNCDGKAYLAASCPDAIIEKMLAEMEYDNKESYAKAYSEYFEQQETKGAKYKDVKVNNMQELGEAERSQLEEAYDIKIEKLCVVSASCNIKYASASEYESETIDFFALKYDGKWYLETTGSSEDGNAE